jgi:hypothetical protein
MSFTGRRTVGSSANFGSEWPILIERIAHVEFPTAEPLYLILSLIQHIEDVQRTIRLQLIGIVTQYSQQFDLTNTGFHESITLVLTDFTSLELDFPSDACYLLCKVLSKCPGFFQVILSRIVDKHLHI